MHAKSFGPAVFLGVSVDLNHSPAIGHHRPLQKPNAVSAATPLPNGSASSKLQELDNTRCHLQHADYFQLYPRRSIKPFSYCNMQAGFY